MKKVMAIYARRSKEDNRSLSIASQIADCKKSLNKEDKYKEYTDNGISAKDIEHRPAFMQMMADARDGLIKHIIIKKYDRFSRDLRDSLNVFHELDNLGIGVTSIDENFDTSTDVGKMMRNMVFNFAELERRRTADRVTDAYVTRANTTGFFQGGRGIYYGYGRERIVVNGVMGSVLVPNDKAEVIKTAYEMYMNPTTSLADIINHLISNGIDMNVIRKDGTKSNMDRSHISRLLCSPLYVRADKDVYQYLISNGYDLIDDVDAYDGIHGLFRHKKSEGSGYYLKVGYHEGLVDSETWLAVQDRKSQQTRIPKNGEAKNSWLVGLVKCSHCKYALNIIYNWNKAHTTQWRYYQDSGFYRANSCIKKRLSIRPDDVEQLAFNAMKERLDKLVIAKHKKAKPDKGLEKIQVEIIRIDEEIRGLMEKLAMADEALFTYINDRVKTLHSKKSDLDEQMRTKQRKHKEVDTKPLEEPLSKWDSLTIDEKYSLAHLMIDVIYVSDDGVDIRLAL